MPETPSTATVTYRAFVSYSHRDETWARWLHRSLEAYRVPSRLVGSQTETGAVPRRLNPIFRDRDELASAAELGRGINAALAASQSLIVVCSPASAASRWVNEEVLAWKRMGRGERIFCLIVAGEPNATDMPGRAAEECFCPALRFEPDVDGRLTTARTEPIAADARPGKDGKANARLKLIAGMLGVAYDALKQREQHRKVRRMAAITSVAVVVMAATIALAVYALISRHQAVAAQHRAQVAQQAAERRQQQAEGLVDFMVGDLNQKLWRVGRLDIIQSVNDKAIAYFESLPSTDVDPSALVLRAKTLEKIGGVRLQAGDGPGALQAFEASARVSSRLAAAAPRDVARQVAYSRTLAFIAKVYQTEAKYAAMLQTIARARQALQPALALDPGNRSAQIQGVYVQSSLGAANQQLGHVDLAEKAYRRMLQLARQLHAADPHSTQYAQALGAAYADLGHLAEQRSDLAAAIENYAADAAVATQVLARDPANNDQRYYALLPRGTLGRALVMAGSTQRGGLYLRQAVDGMAALANADPRNFNDQAAFAMYSGELARLERLQGNRPEAERLNARVAAIFAAAAKRDPSNAVAQGNYADNLVEQAQQVAAAGQHSTAMALLRNAQRLSEQLLARDAGNVDALENVARAKLSLATFERGPAAAGLRQSALQQLRSIRDRQRDPSVVDLQVRALLGLGRATDAQPLIDQLRRDGYRDPGFAQRMQRARIAYPPNPAFDARLTTATQAFDAAVGVAAGADPLALAMARRDAGAGSR